MPKPVIGPYTHDAFMEKASAFHGYPAPGLLIGGYMVDMAQRQLPQGILYDAIAETVHCLPDAVQLLTPCTLGNGWLRVLPFGIYAVSLFNKHTGEGVRVHLDLTKLDPYPAIRCWFLKERPKKEQDTPRLQDEIRAAQADILSSESVRIRAEQLAHRSFGAVAVCPLCGACHPAAFGGLCRSCQGQSPYEAGPGLAFAQPRLKAVPVAEAVGQKVLHDMTRIVPGVEKGPAFTAGQTLGAGDVCRLQQMGRNRVFVSDARNTLTDWVHEDEAARAFARRMPGQGVRVEGEPGEGKVNFVTEQAGLLLVDTPRLERFNLLPDVMCATRHTHTVVAKGVRVAGSRAIPLYLSQNALQKALALLDEGPLFRVAPMRCARIGILVTGTEIFQGLIQDRFAPIISQKAKHYGCEVVKTLIAPDDAQHITASVKKLLEADADLLVTTAGLSVDPDDVTREGLVRAGLTDVLYGLPVLPGTMSLVGRIGHVQVLGVPACALFFKTTGFDLLLPRMLAGVDIRRIEMAKLGNGGLCMECKTCTFPKCPFGKAV